jgi:serine/threonine-protein kinase RsbT
MGMTDEPMLPGVMALSAMHLPIFERGDVERARREVRALAQAAGFTLAEAEVVVLSTIELATNLQRYARNGALTLVLLAGPRGTGVQVTSRDAGPGIADLHLALQDGHSTGGGFGSGLPGVRRLMDEFEIATGPEGTCIVTRKWRKKR